MSVLIKENIEQRSYAETLVGLLGWVGASATTQPQCSDFSLTDL